MTNLPHTTWLCTKFEVIWTNYGRVMGEKGGEFPVMLKGTSDRIKSCAQIKEREKCKKKKTSHH